MTKPPRACWQPGCPGGDCPHARKPEPQPPDARPNSAERGYDRTWRRLRLLVLHRDPICVMCRAAVSTDVDHIVPKSKGGRNTMSNLRGLCGRCHDRFGDKTRVLKRS